MFMDGARIANAVSKLNVDIKEITKDIGIDAFTWGGIKNGGLADVLVLLNPDLASGIQYVYKQFGQDCAKSRFYSATVNALLDNDIWIENAKKANDMASKLFNKIKDNPNLEIVLPVETNFIWAKMKKNKVKKLNERFVFYEEVNDLDIQKYKDIPFLSRLMTNWATTEEEVNEFADAINSL
jgi:threonine aldolase